MKIVFGIFSIFLLVGCSSFQGRPSPVIPMNTLTDQVDEMLPGEAIGNFYSSDASKRGGLTRKQYRNKVIGVYMAAINARYHNFVVGISSQRRGAGITLETLALGLSTGATLANQTTANALSAGAAFATGSNSQVDKQLFYQQALPAIISAMNASREKEKVILIERMGKTADAYPMELAFMDLANLQNAASIDQAIGNLTSVAAGQEAEVRAQSTTAAQGFTSNVAE